MTETDNHHTEFVDAMRRQGWVQFDGVLDPELVVNLQDALMEAYGRCRHIQIANGITEGTEGTSHHILSSGSALTDFLDRGYLFDRVETFLSGPFILNSFGGVINRRRDAAYVGRVHRDVRHFTGDVKLMINMLVMLDDFELANGATHVMTGSHRSAAKPSDADFYARSDRVVGKSGSVVLFDSHLWHAAGENHSDNPRRALTLTFTPPYIKQQLDYPRLLGYEYGDAVSANLRQVLGYNARVPTSLDEWYQPPDKRLYRPGQG